MPQICGHTASFRTRISYVLMIVSPNNIQTVSIWIRVSTPYANFSHVNVAYASRVSRHDGSVSNTPSTPSTCSRGRSLLLWNVGCVEIRQSTSSPRPIQQYQLYSPTISYKTPHPFPWWDNMRRRHNKSTHMTKPTTESQHISKDNAFLH